MGAPARSMARWKKIILWAASGVVLFTVIGFFVVPPILKSFLTKTLTERLHRPTSIQHVRFNPFTWSLQVVGVVVLERDGLERFLSFEELDLNVDAMSLVRMGPVVSEVKLTQPFVSLIRNDDLTYNVSDLITEFASTAPADGGEPAPADSKPLRFSINNIQLLEGSLDFNDRPKHAHHTLRDFTVIIPFLSNLPRATDIFTEPAFFAVVNGTAVGVQGKTKPFHDSLATEVEFSLRDFEIPKYLEYLPGDLNFAVPSALLDCRIILAFTQYDTRNPTLTLTGTIDLKQVVVKTIDDRPVFNVPRVAVVLDSVDVFENKLRAKSVLVQKPHVNIRRDRSGHINLIGLGMKPASQSSVPAAEPEPSAKPAKNDGTALRLEADEFKIVDAALAWNDEMIQPPFAAKVNSLTLTVTHFTNEPGKPTGVELSLATDAGETVTQHGEVIVAPLAARGSLEVRRVPIKRYAPYYGAGLPFTVEKGIVEASTRYVYQTGPGDPVTKLSDLVVAMNSLRVRRHGDKEDLLTVPQFSVTDTEVDVEGRTIAVGGISSRNGSLLVQRTEDGTLNVARLIGGPSPAPSPSGQPGEQPNTISTASKKAKPDSRPPWLITIKKLRVDEYVVSVEDRVPAERVTVRLAPVTIAMDRFSTAKNSQAHLSVEAAIAKAGKLSVKGPVGLNPVTASLRIDLPELDMVPLQPYVTDKLRVTVASGVAATKGILRVTTTEKQEQAVQYTGEAHIHRLAVLDQGNAEDLVKFSALALTGLQASTNPLAVHVNDVTLNDLDVRLVMKEDGTANVTSLVRSGGGDQAHKPQPSPQARLVSTQPLKETGGRPPAITIGTVAVRNGRISFTDRSLKPHYSTALTQIAATVTGLTSETGKAAVVDLRAKMDDMAPLEVRGTVNPLAHDLFVDLDVDFKGMDLSPLTPYAGKYAGYAIQKGTLSLDLKYQIEGRNLDSSNKALVSQFSFGEARKSPDATNLPVKLAVSLLKDRHGDINLNIPVTGSLDDPSFSVVGVVLGIIKNLLMKAATSPFALLAAATGAGEEFSHVEFQPGSDEIDASVRKRLTTMASLLADRPEVKLDITGRVDPVRDQEALMRVFFQRKLKAQKLADLVKQGQSVPSLDSVTIEPAEFSTYLKKAYKKEDIPGKPTYIFGILRDIPDAEMERLLLSVISVTQDDLRQLAQRRAQAVKEYLVTGGPVEGERMFLVEGGTLPEEKTPGKASRVDFSIK